MIHTVTLPHNYEWHTRAWAADNCPSYLSCTMYGNFGEGPKEISWVEYHFDDEKDAVLFTLKWS